MPRFHVRRLYILPAHEIFTSSARAISWMAAVETPYCRTATVKIFRLALHKKSRTLNAKISCAKSITRFNKAIFVKE